MKRLISSFGVILLISGVVLFSPTAGIQASEVFDADRCDGLVGAVGHEGPTDEYGCHPGPDGEIHCH